MKLKSLSTLAITSLLIVTAACDDHDKDAPGLYTELEEIATYPGDAVWVEGQVSTYTGISRIDISCDAWGVSKTIIPKGEPTVFNYSWQMSVPTDATFPQVLLVKVTDTHGNTSERSVDLTFAPDVTAPWTVTELPAQVSVDFEPDLAKGVWELSLGVEDDRALTSAVISIPDIAYNETIELTGKASTITRSIDFTSAGTFPAHLAFTDASDNCLALDVDVVVMLAEEEDPIDLYDQMYAVIATENESDYLNGYYHFMDPSYSDGEPVNYTYICKLYAPTDGTQLYFTPTKSLDGDLFGASPFVSSKLLNKNGYVVPVVIEKAGYYYVWIDIANHCYSIAPLEAEPGVTEQLLLSGTGFVFGDWGAPLDYMTQVAPGRYEMTTEIVSGYSGDIQYYFYTDGWARVFRADAAGQWWFESATGACCAFRTDYSGKVLVTFDSTEWWATIRKAN
ncbi:MAG: hypothetical protein LUC85_10455 [Bacteroidales bacterium]|nr:hypothetical protein [Bacteroidales bacterium]MCD8395229.1 hypothetical protein [Bacteroidales bacterium]